MELASVKVSDATPVDLIAWIEKEFTVDLSSHTRDRFAKFGVNSSADLERFLISVEPQELIWIIHPVDILSFFIHIIMKILSKQKQTRLEPEQLICLKIVHNASWGMPDLTLIPLDTFEERVEAGDTLKGKIAYLWKSDLGEYHRSPHHLLAEMENICLEIEHLRTAAYVAAKTLSAIDGLFLKISKLYEQYIKAFMYFCRAVMTSLLRDSEPAEKPEGCDSWTLEAMEKYICTVVPDWLSRSAIDSKQCDKLIDSIGKLFGEQTGIIALHELARLRKYRNFSVHGYLTDKQQREYLDQAKLFLKNAKEMRLATGYITSFSRSATATRITLRIDGTSQEVNLLYRDLALYTPFRSQRTLDRRKYKIRVMAFPLTPDERGIIQPFLVEHGIFETREGRCQPRNTLCYMRLNVEYSIFKDTPVRFLTGAGQEVSVGE